ncbi:cytochrome c [Phenylobacterium sp.]|uniref:c-type cytochrome n=1 Tax=Phenylobacterium sp. TaxID=1871053 RepID=UPI002C95B1C0|nr:cytochrome c [Phenylobacterium sp.]HVI30923.1 cytochrome c [Phenylobacterium sp.]
MRIRLFAFAIAAAAMAAPSLADEPGPGGAKPPVPKTGEEVYRMYCQTCHMADAAGARGAGAFPALARNERLGTAAYAIYMVENGKGGMPPFRGALTSAQVAELVTYLRTHFGNTYAEPVTAAEVEAMRPH